MLCVCLCLFGWRLSSVTTTGRDLHWITAEAGLFWPRSQGLPREGVEATGLGHCDREGGAPVMETTQLSGTQSDCRWYLLLEAPRSAPSKAVDGPGCVPPTPPTWVQLH